MVAWEAIVEIDYISAVARELAVEIHSITVAWETHRAIPTCPFESNTTGSPTMEVTARNLARTLCAVCAAVASSVLTRGTLSARATTARIEASAFSLKGNLPVRGAQGGRLHKDGVPTVEIQK